MYIPCLPLIAGVDYVYTKSSIMIGNVYEFAYCTDRAEVKGTGDLSADPGRGGCRVDFCGLYACRLFRLISPPVLCTPDQAKQARKAPDNPGCSDYS